MKKLFSHKFVAELVAKPVGRSELNSNQVHIIFVPKFVYDVPFPTYCLLMAEVVEADCLESPLHHSAPVLFNLSGRGRSCS